MTDVPQDFRADMPDTAEKIVARMMREHAEQQGYHPVGEPVLTWVEITQMEVDIQVSVYGYALNHAGDWHVRGVLEVAEDAEIGS